MRSSLPQLWPSRHRRQKKPRNVFEPRVLTNSSCCLPFSFSPLMSAPSFLTCRPPLSVFPTVSAVFQRPRARAGLSHPKPCVTVSRPLLVLRSPSQVTVKQKGGSETSLYSYKKCSDNPKRFTGSPGFIFLGKKKEKSKTLLNKVVRAGLPTAGQFWEILWI